MKKGSGLMTPGQERQLKNKIHKIMHKLTIITFVKSTLWSFLTSFQFL